MAPGAASPVDFTTAYMPAATTYSSRECQPSPTPKCTVWKATSLTVPSDYVTMVEYVEARRSTYIVDDDNTSFTYELLNATNPLSDVDQWRSAIATAVPASIFDEDQAVIAASDGISKESWVQAMPSDVRRYYVSAYLPQFTTRMVYYEAVAPTHSVALSSVSREPRGIVSYEFELDALKVAGMGATTTMAATTEPIGTTAMPPSSAVVMTSLIPAAATPDLTGQHISHATAGQAKGNVLTVAITIPTVAVVLLICCMVFCCIRRRRGRYQQGTAFERRRMSSIYRVDYNAKPVYPHKPLQHFSDTSFGSSLNSDRSSSQDNPPVLPPLHEFGESGLMLADEEEKGAQLKSLSS